MEGKDNQTIALEMGLSIKTVENHLTRLYRLLNVKSRLEAVNFIMRHPQILGRAGQQAAKTVLAPSQEVKNISVLVVDDNPHFRDNFQHMIGKANPQVVIYEAESIHTAVHLAQQVQPELAFIDVVLGDEYGISCARQIKIISPHTRVVLISAYPDREFHRQGLEAGAVAFLDKKDLNLSTLHQLIEDVL
jgi:DNA-binding NarL/FixJ family response regulator